MQNYRQFTSWLNEAKCVREEDDEVEVAKKGKSKVVVHDGDEDGSRVTEELKGKQHKLDKNKNGRLDAHDFELLHKEEEELDEAQYGVNLGSRPVSGQKEYQGKEIKSFHPNKEKEAREFAKKHGYVVKKKMLAKDGNSSITHTWDIHKEDVELDEANFADTMKKAIAAHERGDHARAKYHLNNAKTARYAMKSTEISKHKDLLDKYKELRDMHEETDRKLTYSEFVASLQEAELDEAGAFSYGAKPPRKGSVAYNAMMKRKEQEKKQAPIEPKDQMIGVAKRVSEELELSEAKIPVQHATDAVHKVLGQKSVVKFLTHLRPGTEKHTSWDKVNDALVKQGVKPQHIASIATHVRPAQYEEFEIEEGIKSMVHGYLAKRASKKS